MLGLSNNPNTVIGGEKSGHNFFLLGKSCKIFKNPQLGKYCFPQQNQSMLKLSKTNVHVSCNIFIFLSAGCEIMSPRRSCVYLLYRVKGSFSLICHCGEVQILFNMNIEVLLEEEVIIGQGKGITGSGAVPVQPL